jgi:hypothetical protein
MSRFLTETFLFLAASGLFFGLPWLVWRRLKAGRPSVQPRPIGDDGAGGRVVPLVAAFHGIRGLPWVAVASNNLKPRLVVTPTGIDYRVVRSGSRTFGQVEQVDVRTFGATVNLSFAFRDSRITFDANVGSEILARAVLALLPGTVALSDRATKLLEIEGG